MIIFAESTDGIEYFPSEKIKALILKENLPHLSKLATNARKTNKILISCPKKYDELKSQI